MSLLQVTKQGLLLLAQLATLCRERTSGTSAKPSWSGPGRQGQWLWCQRLGKGKRKDLSIDLWQFQDCLIKHFLIFWKPAQVPPEKCPGKSRWIIVAGVESFWGCMLVDKITQKQNQNSSYQRLLTKSKICRRHVDTRWSLFSKTATFLLVVAQSSEQSPVACEANKTSLVASAMDKRRKQETRCLRSC